MEDISWTGYDSVVCSVKVKPNFQIIIISMEIARTLKCDLTLNVSFNANIEAD